MPVPLAHPGVYITEIPSGSRTITGVATSITAFVGRALRGPVDEPVPIFSYTEFVRVFGGLWTGSGLGYAVRDFYANGGGQAIVVRIAPKADTASIDVGVTNVLPLAASGPGAWGKALTVTITHPDRAAVADVATAQGVDPAALFHVAVTDGGIDETYLNVTVVDGPRRVDQVLASSALVRVDGDLPTAVPEDGAYTADAATDVSDGEPEPAVADYLNNLDPADPKRGIYALLKADLFNILCLPPPSGPAGDLDAAVWFGALEFCAAHRAFLVVDPPSDQTVSTIPAWVTGTALLTGQVARNAAVYFPRLRATDPLLDGAMGVFAPCGAIAGIMARTDATRGVWKAPAGVDAAVGGFNGLAIPLADSENGLLNPVAVNCMRTFRGIGTVVWGARTARGSDLLGDEYKYVPVRRLALFLEETLYRSTQWAVFEPNDEPLWGQIRTSIGAFMQDLFRQGAFQGKAPRDAYFVRCDAETTTQYDIDRGIVNIIVGFAPLKPAEFVVIGIQQKTATATV